jgi:hypothetical protein
LKTAGEKVSGIQIKNTADPTVTGKVKRLVDLRDKHWMDLTKPSYKA